MTRVHVRLGEGVDGVKLTGPSWEESGPSVRVHHNTPITKVIQGLLPLGGMVGGVSSGGLRAYTRTNLQIHFVHQHVRYTIVIMEEGN